MHKYLRHNYQITVLFLTAVFTLQAQASMLGDDFIEVGNRINKSSSLTSEQQSELNKILSNAETILNGGSISGGYICIGGSVTGPNNFNVWTGDSNACDDPDKVLIGDLYVCVTGTLYGPDKLAVWSGNSEGCVSKVKLGRHYACADGTVYGPNGFQKWTGNSNACASIKLD